MCSAILAGAGKLFHNVTAPLLNTFFSLFRVRHSWFPASECGFISRKDKHHQGNKHSRSRIGDKPKEEKRR